MHPFTSSILFSLLIRAAGRVACLKITGRLEWENREQPQPVAASPQEALGYESRGEEAKRRGMSAMEEKALMVYIRE